jgi:FlaA1/EpsC-like NDP-sugar epimerase
MTRYAAILAVDAALAAVALGAALLLRFDGEIPEPYASALLAVVAILVASRLAANVLGDLHSWSFHLAGLPDAARIALAGLAGTALAAPLVAVATPARLPWTVVALEFFLSTSAFGAVRFGPRLLFRWTTERRRRREGAVRTVIVGLTPQAELLARDIVRSDQRQYDLVGYVGTWRSEQYEVGRRLDGKPILGVLDDLPDIVAHHAIGAVLLAIDRPPAARLRQLVSACASWRVSFKVLPARSPLDERVTTALLGDLEPEDLLPRPAVRFDEGEIRGLIAGRRAMVTGAGGSIGGELCRQLAHYGAAQLVMVDMNENELYLSARRLAEERPDLDVRAAVADLREASRLQRLGERFRPELVFHAGAHKHVPLMEEAPEEAVKNNVFGTLNVARMADACGAGRLVLVSTDKAVNPTSVMGATKRVAELVVRDLARRSRTRMTAVRFGNVLGSAGSVVPLFKAQIARGGPVTVTHPDCTRYFMTIPEAVGLVLVAGLGDLGELCVLDMGEPIRVDELARVMCSLSGRVPGEDVQIVYTGLRAGEKLHEELLTEEEEQATAVRDRIRSARSPAPPPDLEPRLAELRRLADAGDGEGILRALQALVPSYRPHAAGATQPAHPTVPAPARWPAALGARPRVVAAMAAEGLVPGLRS